MQTDIPMIRSMIEQFRASQPPPDPFYLPYSQEDIQIPVRDGRTTGARIYKPKNVPVANGLPGMLVFHGGGFAVGSFETVEWLCRLWTDFGGVAVNVDYRHAPEHVFPAAPHDAFDATKWTAENAQALGIDASKGLLVAGESAGADLALVVAGLCMDEGLSPPLTGVYAALPSCVTESDVPQKYKEHFFSHEQNADAPMLKAVSMEFVDSIYKPDRKSPWATPLVHKSLAKFPPTYLQACGLDPVRDCAIVLEGILSDAGVETRLDTFPGLPHGFWLLPAQLTANQKHTEQAKKGLEWLLAKSAQ